MRGTGIGTVTAEDHHHQTGPTKKIIKEQEGKEDTFGFPCFYEALKVQICAYIPGLKLKDES